MKSIVAAGALLAMSAPAMAGPYANIENNASWSDGDYSSAVTEIHGGYEFENGVYIQGGPAIVHVEDVGTETEVSGKLGVSRGVTENIDVYGEVSFLTVDQEFDFDTMNVGTKIGMTYRF